MKKLPINTNRFNWCLDTFEIHIDDLAPKIGVKKSIFKQTKNGIELTVKQIQKLASFFNKDVLFFLENKPISKNSILSPQFRTMNSQKPETSMKLKQLVERFESQREIYLSLLEDLDEKPNPSWKPKSIDCNFIRNWLNLDHKNSFNEIRQAVEEKGILVFRTNGYKGVWQIDKNDPMRGFSMYFDILPIIVIKKQDALEPQAFTLLHELGHLFLHGHSHIDYDEDFNHSIGKEGEANDFAGKVLVPDEALTQLDDNYSNFQPADFDKEMKPFAKKYCVSVEVIIRRLLDNKRISREQYNDYRKYKSTHNSPQALKGVRMYRHLEPVHIFGESYVKVVLDALHQKHITLFRASTYLDNLKIKNIHKLEKSFV